MSKNTPKVRTVEFVGAIGAPGQKPPSKLPQIAIAGRSNVGKSTLVNRLVGRKNLARTSKRPGRTQEINFFLVDDRFLLVDLPGYGFARAPKNIKERWSRLIQSYLRDSQQVLGIVLLVDARRGFSTDDDLMVEYIEELGTPTLFALTKTDKLKRPARKKTCEQLISTLGIDADQLVETSARTGEGIGTLLESLYALLESP